MYRPPYEDEADHLHHNGDGPGGWVGDEKGVEGTVLWEDPEDPHNSSTHRTDNGKNHGHAGMSHSAEGSREKIHDTAEEIRHCGNGKDLHAAADYLRILCINLQNLTAEYVRAATQHKCDDKGQNPAIQKHPVHTLIFPHTVILAGKAHTGLGHSVYRGIKEAQHIVGCRISCHGCGAKGIYRGLKQSIGKVNNRALDPCRNSHLKNLHQIKFLHAQPGKAQLIAAICLIQAS